MWTVVEFRVSLILTPNQRHLNLVQLAGQRKIARVNIRAVKTLECVACRARSNVAKRTSLRLRAYPFTLRRLCTSRSRDTRRREIFSERLAEGEK